MTKMQVVILAILVESGEPMTWRGISKFLDSSRISIMTYSDEIEGLVARRWIIRKGVRECGGQFQGFRLEYGVVTALRHNKVFEPEKIDGLTIQDFIKVMSFHLKKALSYRDCIFDDIEEWLMILCKANPQLPLCQKIYEYKDNIHVQSLLLLIIHDYNLWAGTKDEGLHLSTVSDCYGESYDADDMRTELEDGTHQLMLDGLVEHKCEEGIANPAQYLLTRKCKEELLEGFVPKEKVALPCEDEVRSLRKHNSVKEKPMFYNEEDRRQIEQLMSFLSQENFVRIQKFVVPFQRQTRGKGQWTMDDGDEAARESQVDI